MFRPASLLALGVVLAPIASSARPVFEPAPDAARPVRVALYTDTGASKGYENVIRVLGQFPDVTVARVTGEDIRAGRLAEYDVLIQPGGSGGGQGKALGEDGRERIRGFVKQGGGYVGICAGSYLASCDYPWSLNILNAKVLDKAHWARGNGDVQLSVTPAGRSLLGLPAEKQTIPYRQGPLLAPAGNPDLPTYEPLATFATEIALKGAPSGVMVGTTAAASAPFGEGKVVCFSPHPELLADTYAALHRAVLWTATIAARARPR